jgi:hypothetical protein
MDTALFYPGHLGLTPAAARDAVLPMVDEAERHGGALTLNWHDRSLAPERLWGGFYVDLVGELKHRGAWFPTAAGAAAWFRRRRAVAFDAAAPETGTLRVTAPPDGFAQVPRLTVRMHVPPSPEHARGPHHALRGTFTDLPLQDSLEASVPV